MSSVIRQANPREGIILSALQANLNPEAMEIYDRYLQQSSELWIGIYENKLVIIWGLVPSSLLSTNVYLWSTTFPSAAQCKRLFCRRSKDVVNDILHRYDSISGLCHPRVSNLRWLKWLGAEFGLPYQGLMPFIIRGPNG